jgi:hypothetical protein
MSQVFSCFPAAPLAGNPVQQQWIAMFLGLGIVSSLRKERVSCALWQSVALYLTDVRFNVRLKVDCPMLVVAAAMHAKVAVVRKLTRTLLGTEVYTPPQIRSPATTSHNRQPNNSFE